MRGETLFDICGIYTCVMAFSKKNKRKITVGENAFYWFYDFQKDILRLTVMSGEKTYSRLVCDFKYKNLWLYFSELVKGEELYDNKILIISAGVLTPWVVRQVIDYGLKNGWQPFTKGPAFIINDIEASLDINLWTESTSETRKFTSKAHDLNYSSSSISEGIQPNYLVFD